MPYFYPSLCCVDLFRIRDYFDFPPNTWSNTNDRKWPLAKSTVPTLPDTTTRSDFCLIHFERFVLKNFIKKTCNTFHVENSGKRLASEFRYGYIHRTEILSLILEKNILTSWPYPTLKNYLTIFLLALG